MPVNNALALGIRPPEFNIAPALLAAAQIQNAGTQNQLAQLALQERGMTVNALTKYRADMDAGDPNAARHLTGFPDLQAKVLQVSDLQQKTRATAISRVAREVAPYADTPEFSERWKQGVEKLYQEGNIDQPTYERVRDNPNKLALNSWLRMDLPTPQFIATQQAEQTRQTARELLPTPQGIPPTATPEPGTATLAPRGIRNNNPLNIEAGPFASKIPGYVGTDGRFAKFKSPQDGVVAADKLLTNYGAQGIDTVEKVIARWAPAHENNVQAYAGFVSKKLGISPSDPIDLSDPALRATIIGAMATFENGRPIGKAPGPGTTPTAAQPQPSDADAATVNRMQRLLTVMTLPNLDPGTLKATELLMKSEIDNLKTPDAVKIVNDMRRDWKKYGFKGADDPKLYEAAIKRAAGVTTQVSIDQRQETEAVKARVQTDAAVLKDMQDKYGTALRLMPAIDRAIEAVRKAPSGWGGPIASMYGNFAGALGIKVPEGASEAQVLQSVTTQLAGLYRLPGPVSEAEMKLYMQAALRLGDTREANLAKAELFKKLMHRGNDIIRIMRSNLGEKDLYDKLAELEKTPVFSKADRAKLRLELPMAPDGKVDASALQVDTSYDTPMGPAVWNGSAFETIK